MKLRLNIKTYCATAAFAAMILLTSSCKKDNDEAPSTTYPKTVTIQYKVTATGFAQAAQLTYTNEGGGITTANNVPLPFTKTITKTVNKFDAVSLLFSNTGIGSMKGEILVDNVIKVSQPYTSNSAGSSITGSAIYIFQ